MQYPLHTVPGMLMLLVSCCVLIQYVFCLVLSCFVFFLFRERDFSKLIFYLFHMWCLRITVLPEVAKTFIVKIHVSDDHSQLQIFFQTIF